MRVLLVAYPGAGKGTQATKLAAHYGIAQLSSGEFLRTEVARGTRIGKVAADYLERGDLVPVEVVLEVLSHRSSKQPRAVASCSMAFPSSLRQAEAARSLRNRMDSNCKPSSTSGSAGKSWRSDFETTPGAKDGQTTTSS